MRGHEGRGVRGEGRGVRGRGEEKRTVTHPTKRIDSLLYNEWVCWGEQRYHGVRPRKQLGGSGRLRTLRRL